MVAMFFEFPCDQTPKFRDHTFKRRRQAMAEIDRPGRYAAGDGRADGLEFHASLDGLVPRAAALFSDRPGSSGDRAFAS
jgi:hypothetical protein